MFVARRKTSCIKALYHRAKGICNNKNLFKGQLKQIASFMLWNGFPKHIRHLVINRLKSDSEREWASIPTDDRKTIWIRVPYLAEKGEQC